MRYDRKQLEAMPDHQLARLVNVMAGCEHEVCYIHTGARRPATDDDLAKQYGVGVVKGTPLFRDTLDGDGMLRLMEWLRDRMYFRVERDHEQFYAVVNENDGAWAESACAPRALAIAALLAGEENTNG